MSWLQRLGGVSRRVSVLIALVLVIAAVLVFARPGGHKTLTASFPQTNSLYVGSAVKILGVPVGTVESITAAGDQVKVSISYDADVDLPRNVQAVVVSPSIVGDRFVQLTPAYDGGPRLQDGARLGRDRTAVPVELDQVYSSLNDLSKALGPQGANEQGALSRLVDAGAEQVDGQGTQINETLRNLGRLSATLDDNKDELFGSVREINDFVDLLNRNDTQVRSFFESTADVSEVLAGERDDLAATLKLLVAALTDVRDLVSDNREVLRDNVENLTDVARVLGKHQGDIDDFTVKGPTALSNVALTYNGTAGTLDNRADLQELLIGVGENAGTLLCGALSDLLPREQCNLVGNLLDQAAGGLLGVLQPRAAVGSSSDEVSDPLFAALQEAN